MDILIILRKAFDLFCDDSDSEDELFDNKSVVKNENYAEFVVPNFSDQTFKSHFRITAKVFDILCSDIHEICNSNHGPGRSSIQIEKKLMITLWYLGNQECLRSIAARFGVCIATVWRIVRWTCDILLKLNRRNKYIQWPDSEAAVQTSQHYLIKNRFRGIIGSIDSSHIPIRSPTESHNSYINRNGFHSVLLQGICNHKMEFMHCYTGEVGSIHDALLLRRSGIINKISSGEFNINADQHLLGDSAYPLKNWLITPYKDYGQQSEEQKIFNRLHSKCRVTIERAFGLLKGRFRRLFYIDCLTPTSIVAIIIASCLLHNICIQNNDVDESYVHIDEHADITIADEGDDEFADTQSAASKRQNLLNSLF